MRYLCLALPLLLATPSAAADPAPAPAVVAPSGEAVPLAALAPGKPVAVVVMKGTWCRVCMEQLARLAALTEAVDATGGAVVGLAAESPAHARRAQAVVGLPVYADPQGEAVAALGFARPGLGHPMPGLLFVDRCGEVRQRVLGRRPGARQEGLVLEGLRELAGEPASCGAPASS